MTVVEIYCEGGRDAARHERWTVARLEPIDEPDGTLWTVDADLSSGRQVMQYLHGNTWIPDGTPVDIAVEQDGPLRLRYSLPCERCGYLVVRDAHAIEPVLAALVANDMTEIALNNLERLCC